jgi:hypothetical protein
MRQKTLGDANTMIRYQLAFHPCVSNYQVSFVTLIQYFAVYRLFNSVRCLKVVPVVHAENAYGEWRYRFRHS